MLEGSSAPVPELAKWKSDAVHERPREYGQKRGMTEDQPTNVPNKRARALSLSYILSP